ncbi:PerC family transcriptional regulator [Cronobacter turicensis]
MTNEKVKHEAFEELACQLERKNLWRRAADAYLAAFDASKSNRDRARLAKKRTQCLKMSNRVGYVEGRCYLAGHFVGEL